MKPSPGLIYAAEAGIGIALWSGLAPGLYLLLGLIASWLSGRNSSARPSEARAAGV